MQVHTHHKTSRAAFSLVELIIVILIIGILMAFILPAINGAIRSARVATVVTEIKNLEQAIAEFKAEFGVEPPSSIILYEQGTSGSSPHWNDDSARDLLRRQSVAFIRQAFPNFDFDRPRDFNGNGNSDDFVVLRGAECLLFFLGGMCATEDASGNPISGPSGPLGTGTPAKWVPIGFSTDPANPFIRTGTRIGPFYEFDSARIVNVNTAIERSMPEYLDPLPGQTAPYIYVSASEGRGYNTVVDDQGNSDPTDDTITSFIDLNLSADAPAITSPTFAYMQSGSFVGSVLSAASIPFNQNSYQIISPGFDQQFGTGGPYDPDNRFDSSRQAERDNITNFSGGLLFSN